MTTLSSIPVSHFNRIKEPVENEMISSEDNRNHSAESDISQNDFPNHRNLKKNYNSVVKYASGQARSDLEIMLMSNNLSGFQSELESMKARRTLLNHRLASDLNELQILTQPLSASEARDISSLMPSSFLQDNETTQQLPMLRNFAAQLDVAQVSVSSSHEIYESVASTLDTMGKEYLDVFQQAVEKYTAFYGDYSDFLTKLKEFVSADDDKTVLNTAGFIKALDEVINKYPVPGRESTLFPVQTGTTITGGSKEECEAWAKELSLSAEDCITRLDDGTYIVTIDIKPILNVRASLGKNNYFSVYIPMECNSAEWAAWQAGIDLQKDKMQTAVQGVTQRYSNANSTFDNLVKILSSTITTLLENDKAFLNI